MRAEEELTHCDKDFGSWKELEKVVVEVCGWWDDGGGGKKEGRPSLIVK